LVFVPRGRAEDFDDALNATIARIAAGPLLTDRVEDAFRAGAERLLQTDGVVRVAGGQSASGGGTSPLVVRASAAAFRQGTSVLTEECFGPVVVIVEYDDHELVDLLTRLPGSLTATVHRQPGEPVDDIVAILADRAGRLLFDGWPTGVTVSWAQHHGGPWPATTTSHTSVGATAIRRFLRPIVFQNAPAAVLPAELTDAGLAAIPHRHDGGIQLPRLTAEREVDHAG
jgi:NADP-dependent aldehyde dehydrogenase